MCGCGDTSLLARTSQGHRAAQREPKNQDQDTTNTRALNQQADTPETGLAGVFPAPTARGHDPHLKPGEATIFFWSITG